MTTVTAPASTMRLAALDIDVPAAPFTVGTVRTWQGREGQGSQIKVMQGRALLGTLDNDGNGGGVWFRGHSREANQAWTDYVQQYAGLTFTIWSPMGGVDLPLGNGKDEDVATLLSENALLLRDLKKHSRTGICILLNDEKPGDGYRRISGGTFDAHAEEFLRRTFPGQKIRYWNQDTQAWTLL